MISYSIELKNDISIYQSIKIPLKQDWELKSNSIIDDGGKNISVIKLDDLHYKESEGSRIFVIK